MVRKESNQTKANNPVSVYLPRVPDDEDLFHILSSMSIQTDLAGQAGNQPDHSLQVPAHSNHSIVTLQPRSTAGSETDVLYGDHTQFKSIEVGSISLGDQFTECNQVCIL